MKWVVLIGLLWGLTGCGVMTQQTGRPNLGTYQWSYQYRTNDGLTWLGTVTPSHVTIGVQSETDTEITWERDPVSMAVVTQDDAGETVVWVTVNHQLHTVTLKQGVVWVYQQSVAWEGQPVAVLLAYRHRDLMVQLRIPLKRLM